MTGEQLAQVGQAMWSSKEMISALTGSILGALLGGVATLFATKFAAGLAQEAEDTRLAAEAEELDEVRSWRIFVALMNLTSVIHGFRKAMDDAIAAVQTNGLVLHPHDYWRYINNAPRMSLPVRIPAEDLRLFVRRSVDIPIKIHVLEGQLDTINGALTHYSRERGQLIRDHLTPIQTLSTKDLISLDPRFSSLSQAAADVVALARAADDAAEILMNELEIVLGDLWRKCGLPLPSSAEPPSPLTSVADGD